MSAQPPPDRRRGSVLLLGLVISVALIFTLAAALSTTHSLGRSVQYEIDRTAALAIADGVTEAAQKRMLDDVANFREPALTGEVELGGRPYAYTVHAVGSTYERTAADGVVSSVQHYVLTAEVEHGQGHVTVDRVVDLTMTPLFQYMIFYADDLELLPGPSMILEGRVHANGDLYTGCGDTLTVDSEYFRCTGSIVRRRKNDGSETGGTVSVKVLGGSEYRTLDASMDAETPGWATYALDRWSGTVQDGSHGVREVAAPEIGSIKAFRPDGSKGHYHESASLVIVDDKAYDAGGSPINLTGILTEREMYDAREGKTVTVSEIDIAALNASGHFPANGLIYAYRTDASSSQPNGVRVVNGSELAGPLTVVSEDPVYVQGDFNTVNKKGAAVISDAVNLLSNGWSDSGGTMQTAVETTYNLAMITGNVPTPDGGGAYSGGFENLPRFHENWSGVKAAILGSFVNLFPSEIAKAPWGASGVYSPPIREWRFDQDLQGLDGLPPFTPDSVSFQRVLWDDRLPLPFDAP